MSSHATLPLPTSLSPAGTATISPIVRKKLQQCYEHGTRLMRQDKYDFDYAHSILQECVVNDPANLTYVEVFLQNLQRKYNNNKRGSLLSFGGKGPLRKALARKDWMEVFRLAPQILRSNPWDVTTLRGLAEGCASIGGYEAELRYLKNALDANPKDPEVNKHCALSLARIGQFDQAIACWDRIDEVKRGDLEAQKMISELQIAKTQARRGGGKVDALRRAHAESEASTSELNVDRSHESPRPKIQLTARQELEQAIANSPGDAETYLELAQLHVNENRISDAADVLHRALPASGNSLKVQERIEDIDLLRKKQQLSIAEQRAQSDGSSESQQLANQLRDDLNRMELEVFDRRAQRYPGNMEIKFQLGMRLKRAGNLREAIGQFEQARRLPDRRTHAALEIGECLQRQKQYDQALKFYWIAAEEMAPEKADVKNLALYRLGVLAEALKHFEDAERSLAELVERDPGFRDAAPRLDKIRAIRHKQP